MGRRTPLAWLAHLGHGAVPLYWPCCRFDLMDLEIVAEDLAHARKIKRRITGPVPRPPRILLRQEAAA